MKRILFTVLIALVGMAAFADGNGLTTLTLGANRSFWAIGISPNGKYVTGWVYGEGDGSNDGCPALYNTETGTFSLCQYGGECTAVTNDGTMLGYMGDNGYAYNTLTDKMLEWGNSTSYPIACGSTTDGDIIVGSYIYGGWQHKACYMKDGNLYALPWPSLEDVGFPTVPEGEDEDDYNSVMGTRALSISDDGKLICGYMINNYECKGALLWRLNEETGEYELDPICKGKLEYAYFDGTLPYLDYEPTAMSHNGKYIAFTLQDNDGALGGNYYVGLYDVEQGEMIATGKINGDCSSTRVSNDGTVLVHSGDLDSQSALPYIWYPGTDAPQAMTDVFSQLTILKDFNEQGFNKPNDITPDGRYIVGMMYYYFEGEDEDYTRRASWLLDTQEYYGATGIGSINVSADESDAAAVPEYYSIDGKRLAAPQKGVNIVRQGSKTSKVIVQ